MCFTPAVSLTTAIIEFVLAAIIPWKYPRASLRYIFSFFLILLGFYQFTEFMLCQTGDADLWVKIGFITYSFLPAIGLHSVFEFMNYRFNKFILYLIPIFYSIIALASSNFVLHGTCDKIFVTTVTMLFKYPTLWTFYMLYYAGFIAVTVGVSLHEYYKERNRERRLLFLIMPLAVLLMSLPTFILILIFPVFGVRFPSVLCHFAIFVAIIAFFGVHLENNYQKKIKK